MGVLDDPLSNIPLSLTRVEDIQASKISQTSETSTSNIVSSVSIVIIKRSLSVEVIETPYDQTPSEQVSKKVVITAIKTMRIAVQLRWQARFDMNKLAEELEQLGVDESKIQKALKHSEGVKEIRKELEKAPQEVTRKVDTKLKSIQQNLEQSEKIKEQEVKSTKKSIEDLKQKQNQVPLTEAENKKLEKLEHKLERLETTIEAVEKKVQEKQLDITREEYKKQQTAFGVFTVIKPPSATDEEKEAATEDAPKESTQSVGETSDNKPSSTTAPIQPQEALPFTKIAPHTSAALNKQVKVPDLTPETLEDQIAERQVERASPVTPRSEESVLQRSSQVPGKNVPTQSREKVSVSPESPVKTSDQPLSTKRTERESKISTYRKQLAEFVKASSPLFRRISQLSQADYTPISKSKDIPLLPKDMKEIEHLSRELEKLIQTATELEATTPPSNIFTDDISQVTDSQMSVENEAFQLAKVNVPHTDIPKLNLLTTLQNELSATVKGGVASPVLVEVLSRLQNLAAIPLKSSEMPKEETALKMAPVDKSSREGSGGGGGQGFGGGQQQGQQGGQQQKDERKEEKVEEVSAQKVRKLASGTRISGETGAQRIRADSPPPPVWDVPPDARTRLHGG